MSRQGKVKKWEIRFQDEEEIALFVRELEQCTWPYEHWTHSAHLTLAASYLRQYSLVEATDRIRHHIQLYNRTCGDPNGYHETITVLFMRLIYHVLQQHSDCTLIEILETHIRFYDMNWVLTYYSSTYLWSKEAKDHWLEPDLKPINF